MREEFENMKFSWRIFLNSDGSDRTPDLLREKLNLVGLNQRFIVLYVVKKITILARIFSRNS
jgi:hypothetical protein